MELNELSSLIIGRAIKVHRSLGPGLLENVYETCLQYELEQASLLVERQKVIPIVYEHLTFDVAYRIDLLVENRVVVELKTVDQLLDTHSAQTLTYMRMGGFELGLLINFNCRLLKDDIKRFVN